MKTEIAWDAYLDTTARVLEEAAFVFTEPADEGAFPEETVHLTVMDFHGPEPTGDSGRLVLAASPAFGVELAANLLGIEPDDPDAEQKGRDGLKELLNMIGGVLLSVWYGTDAVCRLGLPESLTADREEHRARRDGAAWSGALLTEEEARLELYVETD